MTNKITELRSYADTAVEQGRQVGRQAVGLAQAQLDGVADEIGHTVTGAISTLQALVEPYLEQAARLRSKVTDRAEQAVSDVIDTVIGDKRVARVVAGAEDVGGTIAGTVHSVAGPFVATVQGAAAPVVQSVQHAAAPVVAPVVSLAGRGRSLVQRPGGAKRVARPAGKPATATKAAPKPAAKTATRSTSGTTRTTKAAPAKRTTRSTAKATATKSTATSTAKRTTKAAPRKTTTAKKSTPSTD